MAKQEECSKCKRAKQGGFAGEIKCSFYGRKPQFDDSPCPSFLNKNVKCPECGQEAPPTVSVCPNCGCPLKEEFPQKNNVAQSGNLNQSITNTTKKSNKTPLYALLMILGIGVLVALSVHIISNDGSNGISGGPMRYTIKLSENALLPVDVSVFECNENGEKIYENKFSLERKGDSKTFTTTQPETKKIKVRVSYVDLSRLGTLSFGQMTGGWLPLVYCLSPNETKEIEIGNTTEFYHNEP